MYNNTTEQKANSINQIKQQKGSIKKTRATLQGTASGSMNGGHLKLLTYFELLPGQPVHEAKYHGAFKLLTPKTPVFQNLNITFYSVKVPYSQVFKNYEKFQAYKGGVNEEKIDELPNFGGKIIPVVDLDGGSLFTSITNTSAWRDSVTSAFIPRISAPISTEVNEDLARVMPKSNACPLRAAIKAWNEVFRDRRFDEELPTYDGDTVSQTEWMSYMPTTATKVHDLKFRAKLPDCYYTNFKTDLQGIETEIPNENNPEDSLQKWMQWENQSDFSRNTVSDEMLQDYNIIAQLYDSAPASQNKVELIGKVTQPLNYSAITQNTYNNATGIEEEFRTMGTQGAYSYTNFNGLPLFKNRRFAEACIILVFAEVWAPVVYSSAFDRMDLNVGILDRFRPDLEALKNDVLYAIESGTNYYSDTEETARTQMITGFKRKWSEYFKLRNTIQGDACENEYLQYLNQDEENNGSYPAEGELYWDSMQTYVTNYTYNFYDTTRYNKNMRMDMYSGDIINYYDLILHKDEWKDYTDLMLSRNMAIQPTIIPLTIEKEGTTKRSDFVINGQNQIQYGGTLTIDTTLPIGSEVENNFTKYGEH